MAMRSPTGVEMIETRPKKLVKGEESILNMPPPLEIKQKNAHEDREGKKGKIYLLNKDIFA